MPVYRTQDFEAALERLGFRRKQVGNLSKAQFLEMLNGRLTPETYLKHLLDNGAIQATADREV